MQTYTFFIIPLYFQSVFGLFETVPQVRRVPASVMREELEDPDYMTMIIIYDDESIGSIALNRVLEEIGAKYYNYVKFLALSCEDRPDLCRPETKNQLPLFRGYVPGGASPYTGQSLVHEHPYAGLISPKDISQYFIEHIPYLGVYITYEINEKFLEEPISKVLLFTNKEKVPLIFRGLSSKFRGFLEFGVIFANQTELVNYYDVTEFPTLIVIEKDDVVIYKGKIDFEEISNFLQKYKAPYKQKAMAKAYVPQTLHEKEAKASELPVLELKIENLEKVLNENPRLFLVQFFENNAISGWDDIAKSYNGIVNLATIACKREEELELCQNLGVTNFPSMRLFPVNRKRRSFELSYENKMDIEEEIAKELRYEVEDLQESSINTFINEIQEDQKLGIVLLAEGLLPLSFKALAAEASFKSLVRFGYFNSPKKHALKVFNTKNYPVLIAFGQTDQHEGLHYIEYIGSLNDYKMLYYFIDQQAIPAFSYNKSAIKEGNQQEIDVIKNKNALSVKCLRKAGLCVIGLFEGNVNDI